MVPEQVEQIRMWSRINPRIVFLLPFSIVFSFTCNRFYDPLLVILTVGLRALIDKLDGGSNRPRRRHDARQREYSPALDVPTLDHQLERALDGTARNGAGASEVAALL